MAMGVDFINYGTDEKYTSLIISIPEPKLHSLKRFAFEMKKVLIRHEKIHLNFL